jgi:hypothetical protein
MFLSGSGMVDCEIETTFGCRSGCCRSMSTEWCEASPPSVPNAVIDGARSRPMTPTLHRHIEDGLAVGVLDHDSLHAAFVLTR